MIELDDTLFNCDGGPKVRDRLCQIIRQHQLDATLVKSYATEFCGVKSLREASREQVENFVTHLADWAEKDKNALCCQLNSYLGNKEGAALKRRIQGPNETGGAFVLEVPDGMFLVRVD